MRLFFYLIVFMGLLADSRAGECIAHRGFSGKYPDNTLEAITNAWGTGVQAVEFDVRMLGDRMLVLFHDGKINETPIKSLTYEQFQEMTPDRMPTFAEALAVLAPDCWYLLDLKEDSNAFLMDVAVAIGRAGLNHDQVVLQSSNLKALQTLQALLPQHRTVFLSGLDYHKVTQQPPSAEKIAEMLVQYGINGISGKGREFIDTAFIREFRDRGMRFYVWTINPVDRIQHYKNIGADGIITDHPDVCVGAD